MKVFVELYGDDRVAFALAGVLYKEGISSIALEMMVLRSRGGEKRICLCC